jgi:hypothetical protein
MSEIQDDRVVEVHGTPGWVAPAIVLLALVSLAGLGLAWYDSSQLQAAQQSFGSELKAAQQNTSQQIAAMEQKQTQSDAANTELQGDLGVVTKRLRITQGDLKKSRDEAAQIRDENAQKLAEMDTSVKTELATKASADDLNATNGNVNGVKTDLEGTKNDLKMARSELGTLIARNHDEVDQLRRMGERDYVEFAITGRNKPQKVGNSNLTVELHSVNIKKNRYTVALVVDDVRTEKKDRTVNEPVVFYPRGSHQADEFVVNSVSKDKITGYISMPKNGAPSTTASGN